MPLSRNARLFSSSSRQPRFRVPAHVAAFSVVLLPVVAFAAYASRYGPTEQALEETIAQRYHAEQEHIAAKNQHMSEFFQNTIFRQDDDKGNSNSGSSATRVESQLDAVLRGGRGEKKRLHAVDEKLYGTAEGVAEKKRVVEELEGEKKKQRKRKKPRKKEKLEETAAGAVEQQPNKDASPTFSMPNVEAKQVATVAVVATIAAAAGFLLGGSRPSK